VVGTELTSVAEHAPARSCRADRGATAPRWRNFFAELGDPEGLEPDRSIDTSGEYLRAFPGAVPDAEICFDPFHVCRLASRATDQVHRGEWNGAWLRRTYTPGWPNRSGAATRSDRPVENCRSDAHAALSPTSVGSDSEPEEGHT
jgi:transposase